VAIHRISADPADYEHLIDLCAAFHDRFTSAHPNWFGDAAA
jgi:hypothetical protein